MSVIYKCMPISCSKINKITSLRALNEWASTPHVILLDNILLPICLSLPLCEGCYLWSLSVAVIYGCLWSLSMDVICGCYLWMLSVVGLGHVSYMLDLFIIIRRTLNTSVPCLRICGIGLHHDVCVRCVVTITSFGL
jgi:hypothetical protein